MLDVFEPAVLALAERLRRRGERLVTAESCTGGLIAAACTAVAGSSDWLERGHVTYSNEAKASQLDVPATLIAAHGAVSEPVVEAMARGALVHSEADWSVAVTGIAGPTGGSPGKPVGTVWLAVARQGGVPHCWRERFEGDRSAVRVQTVHSALQALQAAIDAAPAAAGSHGAGDELPPLPTLATGRYRHYKGGEYEVIGVVRHSETLAPLVLYRPLYGDSGTWVRPHGMFLESVVHEGVEQPRFRRLAD